MQEAVEVLALEPLGAAQPSVRPFAGTSLKRHSSSKVEPYKAYHMMISVH